MARRLGAVAVVWAALLVFWGIAPAQAHHKEGHDKGPGAAARDHDGDADSDPGTSYTEDNDTNDGGTPNNVADEGDNAHPSGKDRSVENGSSSNQGNSESDPDDDSRGPDRTNGGPDKPNGSGGVDLADQDGNNGCGNDDDFEDDNEGWCGKPKPPADENEPSDDVDEDVDQDEDADNDVDDDVEGNELERGDGEVDVILPGIEDEVLGNQIVRGGKTAAAAASRAAALPFTGASMAIFVTLGLALIAMGGIVKRMGAR